MLGNKYKQYLNDIKSSLKANTRRAFASCSLKNRTCSITFFTRSLHKTTLQW